MKRLILIIITNILCFNYTYSQKIEKIQKIIDENKEYSCIYEEETEKIEGENFIGNYYRGRPYGKWELKNEKVKQCFFYSEKKYYKKDEYYIVDNKIYYYKNDYKKNEVLVIIKKIDENESEKIYYFNKNTKKVFEKEKDEYGYYKYEKEERENIFYYPTPLYKLMELKVRVSNPRDPRLGEITYTSIEEIEGDFSEFLDFIKKK